MVSKIETGSEVEPKPKLIALLFPGQGLPPEMIFNFFERLNSIDAGLAKKRMRQIEDITYLPILSYLNNRDYSQLKKTSAVQPVIYALSIVAYELFWERFNTQDNKIVFAAGHSLGQCSAGVASGIYSADEGMEIVVKRGEYMQEACDEFKSGLLSIFGLPENVIQEICEEVDPVDKQKKPSIALVNAENLIVVGAAIDDLPKLELLASKKGAHKITNLSVAGASHTPFMESAAKKLGIYLQKSNIVFKDPNCQVVTNLTGLPLSDGLTFKKHLIRTMTEPVQWEKSLATMRSGNVDVYYELGPGNFLTALNRRNSISAAQTGSIDNLT